MQTVTNNALIRCCQTSQLLCKGAPHGQQRGDQKNHTYCGLNPSVSFIYFFACVFAKTSHKRAALRTVCAQLKDLNVEQLTPQTFWKTFYFRHFPRKKYLETSYPAVQTCIYLCLMASL